MMGEVKKRTQHNERFQLSLPVGLAEIEPSPGTFQRSWSIRWFGSQIVDLDSGCPILHFLLGFLLLRRSISSLALSARVLEDPMTHQLIWHSGSGLKLNLNRFGSWGWWKRSYPVPEIGHESSK
jgi:hypothetical protein